MGGGDIESRLQASQNKQSNKKFLKKAEKLSNYLPLGDRDVSKLSSNMEHAYFLAPEKLRFLQSKPPHTCGIRHVKENVLCQPGYIYI